MPLRIAIQPDEVVHHNGERQSYSRHWMALAPSMGFEAVPVDVYSPDIIETISTCDAFMWRYDPPAHTRRYAARLLYAIEEGLRIPVFPSLKSRWHFEDKIAQYYFLAAAGIPIPATTVCWSRDDAVRFCNSTKYPFVLKLAIGYKSSNVRLVHTHEEALFYVDQLFSHGINALGYRPASRPRLLLRRIRAAMALLRGRNPYGPTMDADLQYGYLLAQEFLPDNPLDTRVTVIGNRAIVLRRFNRPGDFRASGSGIVDRDPSKVAEDVVRLGYRVARASGAQIIMVDMLRRNRELVVIELGLAVASYGVRDSPGHWVLNGDPDSGELTWVPGSMEPAEAIFKDFVFKVRNHVSAGYQ